MVSSTKHELAIFSNIHTIPWLAEELSENETYREEDFEDLDIVMGNHNTAAPPRLGDQTGEIVTLSLYSATDYMRA